jgi:hypothetical protein
MALRGATGKGATSSRPFVFPSDLREKEEQMTSAATPPLERIKNRILEYCRTINLGKGHRLLPGNVQQILLSLNADEKPNLEAALRSLVEDGIFRGLRGDAGPELELTEQGFTAVYAA